MIVRIDHKLRIALSELPPGVLSLNYIREALSIPNLERQKAIEQNQWRGRAMPEIIKLWEIPTARQGFFELTMPRGFWSNLAQGFEALGIEFEVDDRTYLETSIPMGERITLKPWQSKALIVLQIFRQGIWKAPAGSGKTVTVLELVRRLKTPSLVIVNTKDILYQWVRRAKSFLGENYPVGIIGDNHFQISDFLTIATAQTIHSRFEKLENQNFFDDTFGFVCLDECHHATAETYNNIINRFNSAYRIGISATPDKGIADFRIASMVLGPIVHETKADDVDILIKPHVYKIVTNFHFNYQKRSDYQRLLSHLINDHERNSLIVKTILMNPGSHSLVVSKRLDHIETLKEELEWTRYPYPIMKLTGSESSEERARVIENATNHPCIVLSTLADEALDIPRLDSLFLTFPQRNSGLVEQQVGRVCRTHPNKTDVNVYDFADVNVGPLDAQWKVRRRDVYQPAGYELTVIAANDIMNYEWND